MSVKLVTNLKKYRNMKGLIKYIAPVFIITIMINFVFASAQVKDGNKNVLQIWIDSANGSNGSVALVSGVLCHAQAFADLAVGLALENQRHGHQLRRRQTGDCRLLLTEG